MELNNLPDGQKVFIDANIFIYHFTGASQECQEFLKSCLENKIIGFTATTILAEVCHRLMIMEAISKRLITPLKSYGQLEKKT